VEATGKPNQVIIDHVLADSFFTLKPVKSLDRNSFAFANIGLPNYSVPEGAATLSSLAVQTDGLIMPKLRAMPKSWVGGRRWRAQPHCG
jgi:anhydro-N-acetylmuramic acid kinase